MIERFSSSCPAIQILKLFPDMESYNEVLAGVFEKSIQFIKTTIQHPI